MPSNIRNYRSTLRFISHREPNAPTCFDQRHFNQILKLLTCVKSDIVREVD
jgi:hypothetical protein